MAGSSLAGGLRAAAPDRYVSLLYAPVAKREALAALYLFDAEIAGIRGRIREPLPGEIRLQWWRDALVAGEPTGNPLADALIDAIRHHDLPLAAFDNYLEARIFDLYDDPMPSRHDLEGYLGETEGAVFQLAALILDKGAAAGQAEIAGHAGCARGMGGIIRSLALRRGQHFVPQDVFDAVGVRREELQGGDPPLKLIAAFEAATREHLAAALAVAPKLPASLRPAFLPLAVASAEFAGLVGKERNEIGSLPQLSPIGIHWISLKAAFGHWPRR